LTGQSGAASEIKLVQVSDFQYEGWTGGNTSGTKAFTISIDTVGQHFASHLFQPRNRGSDLCLHAE